MFFEEWFSLLGVGAYGDVSCGLRHPAMNGWATRHSETRVTLSSIYNRENVRELWTTGKGGGLQFCRMFMNWESTRFCTSRGGMHIAPD